MLNRKTATVAAILLLFLFRVLDAQGNVVQPFASSVPSTETVAPKAADYSSGSHAVSETGAFTYSVPIVVPPGRRGLAPKLALNYSSESPFRGGIAVGWSMDLPHIERDPQRCDSGEICYRSSPWGRLQQVVDVPAGSVAGTIAFRAKLDTSFARFLFIPSRLGPSQWVVRTPDAITRKFRQVAGIALWTLDEEQDAYGNAIKYEWMSDESGPYRGASLKRVEYTSNRVAGLGVHARVELDYAQTQYCTTSSGRSDVPIGASMDRHFDAARLDGARRLTVITTYVKDNPTDAAWRKVRAYRLSYDTAALSCNQHAAPLRYLTQIDVTAYSRNRCGEDTPSSGSQVCDRLTRRLVNHEPPLTFSYGPKVPQLGSPRTIRSVGWGEWGRHNGTTGRLMDMDGDGVLDRVEVRKREGQPSGGTRLEPSFEGYCELVVTPGKYGGGFDHTHSQSFLLPTLKAPQGYKSNSECTLDGQIVHLSRVISNDPRAPANGEIAKAYVNYQFLDYNGDGLPDLFTTVTQTVIKAHVDPDFGRPDDLWLPVFRAEGDGCSSLDPNSSYTGSSERRGNTMVHHCSCNEGYEPAPSGKSCIAGDNPVPPIPPVPPDPDPDQDPGVRVRLPKPEAFFGDGNSLVFLARVYINNGNGFRSPRGHSSGSFEPKYVRAPYAFSGAVKSPFGDFFGYDPISADFQRLIDFDGDGVLDLVYPMHRGGTSCMPSQSEPFKQPRLALSGSCPLPSRWGTEMDLCVRRGQKTDDGVDLNFESTCRWWGLPELKNTNLNPPECASQGCFVNAVKLSFRDMNADGLPDLVIHHKDQGKGLQVYWNTGSRFSAASTLGSNVPLASTQTNRLNYQPNSAITANLGYRNRMLDLDQDGLIDVFAYEPTGDISNTAAAAAAQVNLGDRFGAPRPLGVSGNAGKKLHKMSRPTDWEVVQDIVDVNGDGLEDLATWKKRFASHVGWVVDLEFQPIDTSQGPPRKLLAVDNGHGGRVQVRYTPTSNRSVVTWTSASRLPSVRWVVESVTVEPGFGQPSMTTDYGYKDPIFTSETGRDNGVYRFLGFRRLITNLPMPAASCAVGAFPCTAGSAKKERDYELKGGALRLVSETTYIGSNKVTERNIIWNTAAVLGGASFFTYPGTTFTRTYSSPTDFATHRRIEVWVPWSREGTTAPHQPHLYLLDTVTEGSGESPATEDRRTWTRHTVEYELHYRVQAAETKHEVLDSAGAATVTGHEITVYDNGLPVQTEVNLDASRSAKTERTFDPATGNLISVRKPKQVAARREVHTETRYDAHRIFAREVTNELSHRVETTYDVGTGALLKRTDANQTESWTVDGHGRTTEHHLLVEEESGGYALKLVETAAYFYAPRPINPARPGVLRTEALQASTDSPVWVTSETRYDGIGRQISHTQLLQAGTADAITSFEYDRAGGLATVRVPDPRHDTGAQVAYAYQRDEIGRLCRFVRPDGGTVDIEYSGLARTLTTPGSGERTTLRDDVFGRLVAVSEHDNPTPGVTAVTSYSYDNHDRLTGMIDAEGYNTTFAYDLGGRRVSMTRGGRVWSYGYDQNGNLETILVPSPPQSALSEYQTILTYDDLDRLATRTPGTKGLDDTRRAELGIGAVTYTYDSGENGVGRLTRVLLPFGSVTYSYDPRGRVLKETRTFTVSYLASVSATQWVKTSYNIAGQPTEFTYDDDSKLRISYDSRGLSHTFSWYDHATARWRLVADYDDRSIAGAPRQRKTQQNDFNQRRDWTYDVLGRVLSDQVKTISTGDIRLQRSYIYERNDQLVQVSGHTAGHRFDASYTYDNRHRLLTANGPNDYSQAVSYSKTGNILGAKVNGGTAVSYTYGLVDPQAVDKLRTDTVDFAAYAYDLAGNVVSRSIGSNAWFLEWDTEEQLREAVDQSGVKEAYYYDHTGTRVLAIHERNGVRFWFRESETHYSRTGVHLNRSTHIVDGITPLGRVQNNTIIELQYTDSLQNLMLSLDSAGSVVAAFHYGAFGEIVHQIGHINHRRQFNSKENDAHSGLRYYGARYYDPLTLRWNSGDPKAKFDPDEALDKPQMKNLYNFSANNPLRYFDPDGGQAAGDITVSEWLSLVETQLRQQWEKQKTVNEIIAAELAKHGIKWSDFSFQGVRTDTGKIHFIKSEGSEALDLTYDVQSGRVSLSRRSYGHGQMIDEVIPGFIVGRLIRGVVRPIFGAAKESVALIGRSVGAREAIWTGKKITGQLAETLGMNRRQLGKAVETIKKAWGLRGDQNVSIGMATGDVYEATTGELLGNVLDEVGKW
jgi:RHS repeat-associated protein